MAKVSRVSPQPKPPPAPNKAQINPARPKLPPRPQGQILNSRGKYHMLPLRKAYYIAQNFAALSDAIGPKAEAKTKNP